MADHETTIRVYYEDTDAGGIVYYANYLKYAERARSEWLRDHGVENKKLADEDGLFFVVKSCSLDYHTPAVLDDLITVKTTLEEFKSASIVLSQDIYKADKKLVSVRVKICMVNGSKRPAKIPHHIKEKLVS